MSSTDDGALRRARAQVTTAFRVLAATLAAALTTLGLAAATTAPPAGAILLPPSTVAVTLSSPTIVADGSTFYTMTAVVTDAAGQRVNGTDTEVIPTNPDGDVTFSSNRMSVRSDGSWRGSYKASKTAGVSTIKVTARNAASQNPAEGTATLTEIAGPPTQLAIALSPTHIPADGTSLSTATITIKDANGNGVAGQTVSIGVGSSDDSQPGPVTDNGNGTYTSQIKASLTPGVETVFATGANKAVSANLTEYGAATALSLAITPSTIVANGVTTAVAKATLTDAGGRGVANGTVAIPKPGSADSTITAVTNNGDGTYSATITSSTTAGTDEYTATAGLLTSTASLIEKPGPLTAFTFSLTPTTLVADGAEFSTAKAELRDANNNPITDETVTMTTNGTSTIAAVTNNGDGTYTAKVTSAKTAGTETITAKAVGANQTKTAVLTLTPGPATGVTVTLTPASLTADGQSTSVAKATVKDVNGNLVKTETVVFSAPADSGIGVGATTNNNDGTYSATITSSKKTGDYAIAGKAIGGNVTGTATLTQVHGPAASIALVLTPDKIIADGEMQSVAKATVLDANGNKVLDENVTITKPTTGSDITVTPVTNNGDGTYTATITASTTAGTNLLTAKAGKANKTITTSLVETPGPAEKLTLTLNPTAIPARTGAPNETPSTSTATLTVKDKFDNMIPDENVTITKPNGSDITVSNVTNNNDGTYTATITNSSTPGSYLITGTAATAGKSATATLSQYGAVQTVTVTVDKPQIPADGTTTGTITAVLEDADGRPVTGATVGWGSQTPGDITFGPTTNNGDGSYTSIYTASRTPGTETLQAVSGKTGTVQVIEYGPASTVAVALTPSTITADGAETSTAVATVKDSGGRLVLNEIVTFGTTGDTVLGAVTNNDDGTYTAVITSSTTAGTETITATATKAKKTGDATLTETAGPAAIVTLSLDPASVTADGTSTSDATATVTDVNGNPISDETVKLATSGDAVLGNAGVMAAGETAGTYVGGITASTTSGIESITATALGTGAFGTASLTESPGDAASILLTLSPSTIAADGVSTSTATATVKDANGNLVPTATVTMARVGDSTLGAVTNKNNGTYTAPITASTTAGAETVTATLVGTDETANAVLTEVAGAVASVLVSLDPASIVANGTSTSTATVTVKDANGNLVTDDTVTLFKDGVQIASATNNNDGTYTAQITSSKVAGAKEVKATSADNGLSGIATLNEVAGPLAAFTVGLSPSTLTADGVSTSAVTANLADANGNPIADEVVTIASSGDAVVGSVTNNGDGSYTATITASTTAGAETITATATEANTTKSATLTEKAGPVTQVTLALNPSSIVANGTATSTASATVLDVNDNVVKDAVVTMSTNGDSTLGAVANKGDGTYTSTITSSTTSGIETITASVASAGKSATAALTEVAGPATSVVVSLSPSSIVANGASTSTATATVKDVNGNLVKNEVVTFATNGDVTFGAVTNNNNGTYTSTVTSSKTAGTENITAKAGNANVTSAVAALTETVGVASSIVVTLAPSTLQANGVSTSAVTAVVKDANGNSIIDELVTLATNGDVTFSGVTNNGNGTYTATLTASKTPGSEVITARAGKANKTGSATLTETALPTGYWLTGGDAGVFNYGAANHFGAQGGKPLNQPVVSIVANPVDRQGYWQVASDGGIFNWGSAKFFGSMGGKPLNKPVVGMAPTADGSGYWLVASDGGIFAFGTAASKFYGSMGGKPLNQPIVGMVPTSTGNGYWMVASDGGIFAFGDAATKFFGSMGGKPLNSPIVGMAATSDDKGYWMVAKDGGIFAFGSAAQNFFGSMGGKGVNNIVGMAPTASGKGYRMAGADGAVYGFGDGAVVGSPKQSGLALVQPISGIAGF